MLTFIYIDLISAGEGKFAELFVIVDSMEANTTLPVMKMWVSL